MAILCKDHSCKNRVSTKAALSALTHFDPIEKFFAVLWF